MNQYKSIIDRAVLIAEMLQDLVNTIYDFPYVDDDELFNDALGFLFCCKTLTKMCRRLLEKGEEDGKEKKNA